MLNSVTLKSLLTKDQPLRYFPVLEAITDEYQNFDLSTSLVIAVQHLCSSTEKLFHALLQKGLPPSNLFALGKCYSTNPESLDRLRNIGINAQLSSLDYNPEVSYDTDFNNNINEFLTYILCSLDLYSFEKIIILDDGGHLISAVNTLFPRNLPIVGVEQTSSGFNLLKSEALFFPIVNVARSWLKLKHETPFIVRLIANHLKNKIAEFQIEIENALILGGGILGSALATSLNAMCSVSVFDTDFKRSDFTATKYRERLHEFDLVVGTSGENSLTLNDLSFLKKPVMLASTSSSDREFAASAIRKTNLNKDCHADVEFEGVLLLNSGFPLPFSKNFDEIDLDEFQLTRSLLFLAIYQAFYLNNQPGFVDVDNAIQNRIHEIYLDYFG